VTVTSHYGAFDLCNNFKGLNKIMLTLTTVIFEGFVVVKKKKKKKNFFYFDTMWIHRYRCYFSQNC
jgi:hypothetical protein